MYTNTRTYTNINVLLCIFKTSVSTPIHVQVHIYITVQLCSHFDPRLGIFTQNNGFKFFEALPSSLIFALTRKKIRKNLKFFPNPKRNKIERDAVSQNFDFVLKRFNSRLMI